MPDAAGNFKGVGWSQQRSDAWERIFGRPDPKTMASLRAAGRKPVPRCGPWDDQPDGSAICRKCGDVDLGPGGGPMGF